MTKKNNEVVNEGTFAPKEVSSIINEAIINKVGVKKVRYQSFLNGLENTPDFLEQLIKHSDLSFEFYSELKTIIDEKIKDKKDSEKAKLEMEIKALQEKLSLLK